MPITPGEIIGTNGLFQHDLPTGSQALAQSALFLIQNGGKSWRELTLSPSNGTIGGVDFISSQQGWLTTFQGVYPTTNQGRTWISLQSR